MWALDLLLAGMPSPLLVVALCRKYNYVRSYEQQTCPRGVGISAAQSALRLRAESL